MVVQTYSPVYSLPTLKYSLSTLIFPRESTSRIKWIFPVTKGKRSTSIVKSFGSMRLGSTDFRFSFLNFHALNLFSFSKNVFDFFCISFRLINSPFCQKHLSKPLLNSSIVPFIQGFDGAMNTTSIPTYNANLTNRLNDLGCL